MVLNNGKLTSTCFLMPYKNMYHSAGCLYQDIRNFSKFIKLIHGINKFERAYLTLNVLQFDAIFFN